MAPKPWYSFQGGVSPDEHIDFYDKEELPWTKTLEENWEIIAKEARGFMHSHNERIKPYFNKSLVTKKKSWNTFAFFFWSWKIKKNMALCPETMKTLKKIPNIVSASVSILEPGTEIKPHRGDTNAIMRAHLGLRVPCGLPECGFRVGYEDRSWEEGKMLVFNDSARHTAWNFSKERRYVLLVDVVRPEFAHKKFRVCAKVLGGLIMQQILQKFGFVKALPKKAKVFMLWCIAGSINVGLRLRKVF